MRPRKPNPTNKMPEDGIIRIVREKRRASSATIIYGLVPNETDRIVGELRKLCATGGTAKNGIIELQGDHREKVKAYLEQAGRKTKLAGG